MKVIIGFLAGVLSVFAFEPFSYKTLLFIGFIVYFYLILSAKTKQGSFLIGLFFGVGYFGLGTWWLFSIPDNQMAILLFGSGVILLMAFYYAFLALVLYILKDKNLKIYLIFAPIIATIFEYLRATLFSGFSWLTPSNALFNLKTTSLYATFSSLGITFLFFCLIVLIAYTIFYKNIFFSITIFLWISLIIVTTILFYKKPIKQQDLINIAILSTSMNNDFKENRYKILSNIKNYLFLSKQNNTQIAFWPESSVSVELNDIKGYLKQEFKLLKKYNLEVFFGGYFNKDSKIYNSLIRASTLNSLYNKKHLIPFGEYIPSIFKKLDKYIPRFRMNNIAKGDNNYTFMYKNITFAPTICYELIFSNKLQNKISSADVLVNISDLGWFKSSWVAPYFLKVAQIRAAEFQKPLIYSVNMANSAYILPTGEIKQITTKAKKIIYTKLNLFKTTSLYREFGLKVVFILLVVWIVFISLNIKLLMKG